MSIIRESEVIRKALIKRFEEVQMSPAEISRDAKAKNFKIETPHLTNYLKGILSSSLSEIQIRWLCARYYVPLTLGVGSPVMKGNQVTFEVPPFNETKAVAGFANFLSNMNPPIPESMAKFLWNLKPEKVEVGRPRKEEKKPKKKNVKRK